MFCDGLLGSGCVKAPVAHGEIHCAVIWLEWDFSDGFRWWADWGKRHWVSRRKVGWIQLDFIFCCSQLWPICCSHKKNRLAAADACVAVINSAVWSEEFRQVQQDGCQSGLAFLACWHLIVSLSLAHLLHHYSCKWLSIRRIYQAVYSSKVSQDFFSLLPFYEEDCQSVPGSIRLMAALKPFPVTSKLMWPLGGWGTDWAQELMVLTL